MIVNALLDAPVDARLPHEAWIALLWRALGVCGELNCDRSVVSDWSCEQSVVRTACSVRGSSYLRPCRNRTPGRSGCLWLTLGGLVEL
jgi:hypothetical protein